MTTIQYFQDKLQEITNDPNLSPETFLKLKYQFISFVMDNKYNINPTIIDNINQQFDSLESKLEYKFIELENNYIPPIVNINEYKNKITYFQKNLNDLQNIYLPNINNPNFNIEDFSKKIYTLKKDFNTYILSNNITDKYLISVTQDLYNNINKFLQYFL